MPAAAVQATAPAHPIEGALPTEALVAHALVAHVLVAKYADHLPLHRQAQIHARAGVDLSRAGLAALRRPRPPAPAEADQPRRG